jgi:aryl-alcohol dehydrogenase-like predicted oxidoreductase
MGELIKAGKIKAWGISNETTFGEADAASAICDPAATLPHGSACNIH